jgi:hypothetical protein
MKAAQDIDFEIKITDSEIEESNDFVKNTSRLHCGITYVRKALHLLPSNIVLHLTQTETTVLSKSLVYSSHCHSASIVRTCCWLFLPY